MITAVARVGKKKISPYFPGGTMIGSVYQALCVVVVSLTVNYCVIPFPASSAFGLGGGEGHEQKKGPNLPRVCWQTIPDDFVNQQFNSCPGHD